MKTIFHRKTT